MLAEGYRASLRAAEEYAREKCRRAQFFLASGWDAAVHWSENAVGGVRGSAASGHPKAKCSESSKVPAILNQEREEVSARRRGIPGSHPHPPSLCAFPIPSCGLRESCDALRRRIRGRQLSSMTPSSQRPRYASSLFRLRSEQGSFLIHQHLAESRLRSSSGCLQRFSNAEEAMS